MADGATIAEQIADIAASKAAIAAAIEAKGVTVPEDAKLADLAPLVGQISGGGTSGPDTCEIDRNTMTELVIPEGTTKIGNYAFYGCEEMTSLSLPEGLTSIGEYAFDRCGRLTSLVLPKSLTSIGMCAFRECHTINELTIPGGIQTVEESAFSSPTSLERLTIQSGVTTIKRRAFYDCGSLRFLTLPEGLKTIGDDAFWHGIISELIIPSSVTEIGVYAFSGTSYAHFYESLILPEGLKTVGQAAFSYCFNLKTLSIPSSVASVGRFAFDECPATCNITFAKTKAEVSGMMDYPWGITAGAVIHCTDGDLTVS